LEAELILAPADAVDFKPGAKGSAAALGGAGSLRREPGMREGKWQVKSQHEGVETFPVGSVAVAEDAANLDGENVIDAAAAAYLISGKERTAMAKASLDAARVRAGGYAEGESCSTIDLGEVSHRTRFVQLQLKRPANNTGRYALRNVYVIGPRLADEEGNAQPTWEADEAARASVRAFLDAVDGPAYTPPPPPPAPRGVSNMYEAIVRREVRNRQQADKPPITNGVGVLL